MKEVNFSDSEKALITEFELSADKKPDTWSDDKYSAIKKTIKDHYIKEQNHTCCFCQQRIVVQHNRAWDTEHILSRSSHPEFMFKPINLCVTCIDCNLEKSSKPILHRPLNNLRYPARSSAFTVIHPHLDIYENHLKVIVAGELYQWKTQKGRKTINIYGLDRFYKYTERPRETDSSHEIKQLMKSALTTQTDYYELEIKILRSLLLKNSDKIGAQVTLNALVGIEK